MNILYKLSLQDLAVLGGYFSAITPEEILQKLTTARGFLNPGEYILRKQLLCPDDLDHLPRIRLFNDSLIVFYGNGPISVYNVNDNITFSREIKMVQPPLHTVAPRSNADPRLRRMPYSGPFGFLLKCNSKYMMCSHNKHVYLIPFSGNLQFALTDEIDELDEININEHWLWYKNGDMLAICNLETGACQQLTLGTFSFDDIRVLCNFIVIEKGIDRLIVFKLTNNKFIRSSNHSINTRNIYNKQPTNADRILIAPQTTAGLSVYDLETKKIMTVALGNFTQVAVSPTGNFIAVYDSPNVKLYALVDNKYTLQTSILNAGLSAINDYAVLCFKNKKSIDIYMPAFSIIDIARRNAMVGFPPEIRDLIGTFTAEIEQLETIKEPLWIPGYPKRKQSAYQIFAAQVWAELRAQQLSAREISREIAERWRGLTEKERNEYRLKD